MNINIASLNPNKIKAVEEVLQEHNFDNLTITPIAVQETTAQPLTLTAIIKEATNKAKNAFDAFEKCDLSIGIQSGLMLAEGTPTSHLGTCGCAIYDGKKEYIGLGSSFECHVKATRLMIQKNIDLEEALKETGLIDDKITTKNIAKEAVKMALISYLHKELYLK